MSFAAPIFLLGLLLVPLAVFAWVASRRRARRHAVRFPAAGTLRLAAAGPPRWLRHVPAVLALAALVALVAAMAKPERTVAVPVDRASIMLVTDHSRSMLATDVDPNRITAAKRAARTFLAEVPARVRVGVVSFSASPDAVRAPSADHRQAQGVIDAQIADGATATGDALQVAVDTLVADRRDGRRPPAAIVLLSDGKTTVGRDPVAVAAAARRLRIPIFTISLGTSAATVPNPGFGPPLPATPDPETLARIAQTSGGRAFRAEDDDELSSIYKSLGTTLGTKKQRREVTASFVLAGSLLLLGAGAASALRSGRLP